APTPSADRVEAIPRLTGGFPGVSVMAWSGLTADLARDLGARYMIRGVRTAADFEYEYTLATVNRTISGIETILIPTLPEHAAVSSSVVRELQHFGHDASQFLPH
ncbi:MAG: pantetheine-phosphate adenylyltransferase, partial [Muribaculaceae bacterium]|nr:pantetheine-phosphate adenylyltransferase [Muribaculaceae bacterium]